MALQMVARDSRRTWVLACALLASCGGGGGGGGVTGPASSPVSVTNVRFQALDYEVFEGDDPIPSLAITADVVGDLATLANKTIYVIVEDPDQLYAPNPQLSLTSNGLGNQLTLNARGPNTRTGEFQGNLKVNVCMDAACQRPFGGSPFNVPYRLKVLPGLKIAQQGSVSLSAKFGDPLPSWRSAVRLPQGATSFGSAVFIQGRRIISSAMEVKQEAGALTLQGLPMHVSSRQLDLYVEAEGKTSAGRKVTLSETREVTYSLTAPEKPVVVYTPATVKLVRSSTSPEMFGGVVEMTSPEAEPFYVAARVDYLDAFNGGLNDAKGFAWLTVDRVGVAGDASSQIFQTELRYSLNVLCQQSGPRCMPPGSYLAKVIFITAAGQAAPQALTVRLDIEP